MKILVPALALLLAASACTTFVPSSRQWGTPMGVVTNVPQGKLAGTWHEIARFPQHGTAGCVGTTLTLTPQTDGSLQVARECRVPGEGVTLASTTPAREVGPGRLRLAGTGADLPTSYWLLYLSRDGRMAVVGSPLRDNGFVLSRSGRLTPEQLDVARGVLERNNFDIAALQLTPQRGFGQSPAFIR
jgi:apolipoprotein D and lipocalin family protein